MDEIKIGSKWTTKIISKIINLAIQKKLGRDQIRLELNEIKISSMPDTVGKFEIHMDVDAEVTRGAIVDILSMAEML